MRIGLAYNEKPDPALASDEYAEWDDPSTIDAVEQALGLFGSVVRLEADAFFPQALSLARPDIVFNIAEGTRGPSRESHVPAICEYLQVPYTGSDPLALGLTLHKGRTKEILAYRGVPTAPFRVVTCAADLPRLPLPGTEFTVAILGNGAEARCLPIVGLDFGVLPQGAAPVYGYEAKWVWDTPERPLDLFECPARVPAPLYREIERVSLDAYHALDCRDWCRVDVRVDRFGVPNIVELNPLPGIIPDPAMNSCFPKAARAAGYSYDELIHEVVQIAWKRITGADVGVMPLPDQSPIPA